MINLIFNSDDFGYCKSINYGILEAHLNGVVTSTTMMTNMPGAEHAAELAKKHPTLGVGIHLVLTCGYPVSRGLKTIVNEEGKFFKNPEELLKHDINLKEIETEWRAQIEKFFSFGLKPTHLDSHHHSHTYPKIQEVIKKLGKEYDLPVRIFDGMDGLKRFSDRIILDFYADGATLGKLNEVVRDAKDGETIEIMCHPGFLDQIILNGSSYAYPRLEEMSVLTTWKAPSNVRLTK